MRTPSLKPLLATQFFGAFNDNAWKVVVTFLGIRMLSDQFLDDLTGFQQASQLHTTLTFSVLTLPLILFSLPAGLLADRVSKRHVIIAMKCVELVLMLSAVISLLLLPGNIVAPLAILGLMGAQSALFSPAKYGILPEILPHSKLSQGNARLEMWTFLAIILGSAAGGAFLDLSGQRTWMAASVLVLFALLGLVSAVGVARVPPARSEGNLVKTIALSWRAIRRARVLGLAVAGSTLYWGVASLMGQNVLVYAKTVLGLSNTLSVVPLAVFGAGVGLGCVWAGRLSRKKVEYGLIPLGAGGMGAISLVLAAWPPGSISLQIGMALLGVASGLIVVPLNSLIQWKAPARCRGGVIALSNVFVFSGIFIGSVSAAFLAAMGLSPRMIFVASALIVLGGTAWAIWLLPDALLRLGLILMTHTLYRLRVKGQEMVPQQGGVLLVPNHVSFVDAILLIASLDRPIRFVVETVYFGHWFFKPFMKSLGAIPISSSDGPRAILRALRDAGRYLDEGDVVCIFPEGQITRTGTLLPFQRGLQRLVKNRKAVIIPVYLDRLWGSVFSFEGGRFLSKIPREIPYSVTVAFGKPLEPETPLSTLRQAVQELGSDAWLFRKANVAPLHVSFVHKARRNPFALAFADVTRPGISRLKALAGAVVLARTLDSDWRDQERVGILLPPTVAGALANIAATLSGRVSVNLNYTAGRAGLESAVRQAGLKTILTSRAFVEKAGLTVPQNALLIWIEDLGPQIGPLRRVTSFLAALLLPVRRLERWCGSSQRPKPDDTATIIFSSGSTGEPKGVMLSHFNITSNVEALCQALRATEKDRVLGILPFFHSFGYMSLWFSAKKGLAMPMHPNPLDASTIGHLVHRYRVTILLATPTFLQVYMNRCTPAQFGSLRLVIAGAEKLSQRLALAFEDRFGIRPLEAYGTTECSPAIAVSVPDFRGAGFFQPGSKRGFVGQPLPGVALRTVDPDSLQPLSAGSEGMLMVRGANVMKGYLGREDLTREVLREGWYVTGDIAHVDDDGFLKITDRLSRFSKIGGEMVPHGKVEEALHEAIQSESQIFAVTAVDDVRKGEMLAVLYTCSEEEIPGALEELRSAGLPNLFIPRKDRFLKVEQLPVLGSGKINIKEVKSIARDAFESSDSR